VNPNTKRALVRAARKRKRRDKEPEAWKKQREATHAASLADGVDPKVPMSTWLPTECRELYEAQTTTLSWLVRGYDYDLRTSIEHLDLEKYIREHMEKRS
jgi:hypothetical protein